MSQAMLSWPQLTLVMQTAMVTMGGGSPVITVLWAHLDWFLQLGWRLALQGNRGLWANQFGLLFSVFRTFPDHLKSQETPVFLGLFLIVLPEALSLSLKLSSRKLVYSEFLRFEFMSLNVFFGGLYITCLPAWVCLFLDSRSWVGFYGWSRKIYFTPLSKTAPYIIAIRSVILLLPKKAE